MPLTNKIVTIVAASTKVNAITLYPQEDGSVTVISTGTTLDSNGATVQLKEAQLRVTGVSVIDNLAAKGLSELRKANGLET